MTKICKKNNLTFFGLDCWQPRFWVFFCTKVQFKKNMRDRFLYTIHYFLLTPLQNISRIFFNKCVLVNILCKYKDYLVINSCKFPDPIPRECSKNYKSQRLHFCSSVISTTCNIMFAEKLRFLINYQKFYGSQARTQGVFLFNF